MVSNELHKRFKVYCAKKGIKMKYAFVLAMEIIMRKNR